MSFSPMRRFRINDPKPRLIHAPVFRERVLHHAVMAHVGPVLDRALVADTYACRSGKGTLPAVQRASVHMLQHPWFAQIDIRAYFASISHDVLLAQLARKFKDRGLLRLLAQIVGAHCDSPGRGLPIGTLTSQNFANFYLSALDRHLLEVCRARGLVRYMDDVVWWDNEPAVLRSALSSARELLSQMLWLDVKLPVRLGRSADGLGFCGFRLLPGRVLLSRRRRRRYAVLRHAAEQAWANGTMDGRGLQSGYAVALGLTLHADAMAWRREQLRRHPLGPALDAI
jgi:hypothetical protein